MIIMKRFAIRYDTEVTNEINLHNEINERPNIINLFNQMRLTNRNGQSKRKKDSMSIVPLKETKFILSCVYISIYSYYRC